MDRDTQIAKLEWNVVDLAVRRAMAYQQYVDAAVSEADCDLNVYIDLDRQFDIAVNVLIASRREVSLALDRVFRTEEYVQPSQSRL